MDSSENSICLNCSTKTSGKFCSNCGQKTDFSENRSIKKLLGRLLVNLSFLDNRTLVSIKYLLFKPGKMTAEFLAGHRKKFLNPINLFLFANVLFFFFSPMKDYFLNLIDQISSQSHSEFAAQLVNAKIKAENINFETYSIEYNAATPKLSKLFMITNVPVIALLVYPFLYKRRKYFYDSLILASNFFTFFLLIVLFFNFIEFCLPDEAPVYMNYGLRIINGLIMLIYSYFTIKNVMSYKKGVNVFLSLYLFISIFLAQGIYRTFIFFVTFWAT